MATTTRIDVLQSMGRPAAPLVADYFVVSRDDQGKWLDVYPLRVQRSFRAEGDNMDSMVVKLPTEALGATVFLRDDPAVRDFVIYNPAGAEVSQKLAMAGHGGGSSLGVKATKPIRYGCSHVRIIKNVNEIPAAFREAILKHKDLTATVVVPSTDQRRAIEFALNQMPKALCHAISTVSMMKGNTKRGMVHASGAATVFLSATVYSDAALKEHEHFRLELMRALLHEAGHTLEHLLNVEGGKFGQSRLQEFLGKVGLGAGGAKGKWTPSGKAFGGRAAASLRLGLGLKREWLRMHQSFMNLKRQTEPYVPAKGCPKTQYFNPEQLARAGFMTGYASTGYDDDIADTSAWVEVGPLMRDAGYAPHRIQPGLPYRDCRKDKVKVELPRDDACRAFRRADLKGVPIDLAAVYTKLRVLHGLGAVSDDAFKRCVGKIGFDVSTPGFHKIIAGRPSGRPFVGAPRGHIGTNSKSDKRVFEMLADGSAKVGKKTLTATMRVEVDLADDDVRLEHVSWPRGAYVLGTDARFRLEEKGGSKRRVLMRGLSGFVLVVESSNSRIVGSIVLTRVTKENTGLLPVTLKEPIVLRFMLKKPSAP